MSRLLTILVCSALAMNLVGCGTELVAGEETASEETEIRIIYIEEEQAESSIVNYKLSNTDDSLDESSSIIEEEESENDIEPTQESEESEVIVIVEETEPETPDIQPDEPDEEDVADEEEPEPVASDTEEPEAESSPKRQLTSDEEIMLQKIAYAEAKTEGVNCMATVICVVLNRVESDKFPNSVSGVIYQSGQFSPVSNGSFASAEPDDTTMQALDMVENGWDESQGALYFESCSGSSWHSRNLTYLFAIGRMRFYR